MIGSRIGMKMYVAIPSPAPTPLKLADMMLKLMSHSAWVPIASSLDNTCLTCLPQFCLSYSYGQIRKFGQDLKDDNGGKKSVI